MTLLPPAVLQTLAAICGFLGVALGAFGAHGLKAHLSAQQLQTWHTAVQYHLIHSLALLGVAILMHQSPKPLISGAGFCFLLGIVLFSGSLYGLALSGPRWLGPITPLGGLMFLLGWLLLALGARA